MVTTNDPRPPVVRELEKLQAAGAIVEVRMPLVELMNIASAITIARTHPECDPRVAQHLGDILRTFADVVEIEPLNSPILAHHFRACAEV